MTIGTSDPGRATSVKTPAEVKSAEAELDAIRARNTAAGTAAANLGGTPPPPPVTTPSAASKPAKEAHDLIDLAVCWMNSGSPKIPWHVRSAFFELACLAVA